MLYWGPHFKPHTEHPLGENQQSGFPPLPCANKITSGTLGPVSGGMLRNWRESNGLKLCW